MTGPYHDEPSYLTELPDDLRDRRAAARRRRKWRRRLALGAVVAAVGAVVALAVTTLGGSDGSKPTRSESPEAAAQTSGQEATPGFPADWAPHPGPVPILEYHAIQPPIPGSPYPELFVPQADLEQQMKWLDDHGYEGVTLDQVEDAWYEEGRLPAKPVVISFDGGYLSQFVAAFPLLQALGWPGVLNLKAQDSDLPDAEVEKMIDGGWELASHTITHPDLTTLGEADLEREVAGSREALRRRFGVPVNNFCYPSGRYDETVISAVDAAGYRGAQAEIPGMASAAHPYILNRLQIGLSDGLPGFVSKLESAGAA